MELSDARAEEARAELLLPRGDWSPDTLKVWLRAKGFCEYCGKDLQRTSDDFYHGYNVDHVFPASLHGASDPDNYALACRACNLIKRNVDFTNGESDVSRETLIQRAQEYIRAERERNDGRMKTDLRRLRACGL
jgi:5-methylcytosine-specific restriction endonuclease McrA